MGRSNKTTTHKKEARDAWVRRQLDTVGELPPCSRLTVKRTFGPVRHSEGSPLYRWPGSSAELSVESAPLLYFLQRTRDHTLGRRATWRDPVPSYGVVVSRDAAGEP